LSKQKLRGFVVKIGKHLIYTTKQLIQQNNHIAIEITDNGIGMSQDILSKIFDPFFTTKAVGKSTGLGLSICYQIIVEKHQGKLTCTSSAPNQGSKFIILLPR